MLVSEILTAVATELVRSGSIGQDLAKPLTAAVRAHASFLRAEKKPVLDDPSI